MLNVFRKYGITIPFLIILMKATSHPCKHNKTMMVQLHANVIVKNVNYVKESLTTNFSTCCKSDGDKSLLFPDQCNNSTMENKTRKYFKEDCYNITRNTQSCCQIKNLVYLGCFLYHHSRLRKNAQEPVEIFILRNRLKTLVNFNNDNLCVKLPKKKSLSGKQGTKKQHNENYCKDICKINETLEVFLSRWQQFTSSDECT
ncbi:uncharacterized protein LOC142159098 [Mixophyes fleayi]|uniref:uncharacterized protein LOC142159098 n=1 Tax=Mixophyes fleayi TaxID=3061075 RepID=UPI003F4DD178